MVVSPFACGRISRHCGRKRAVSEIDHDQARRENKETEAGHVAN